MAATLTSSIGTTTGPLFQAVGRLDFETEIQVGKLVIMYDDFSGNHCLRHHRGEHAHCRKGTVFLGTDIAVPRRA